MTPIQKVAGFLGGAGWNAQLEGETLMLPFDESELVRGELYLEATSQDGFWLLRAEAALSLLVEEEGLGEVLLGLNLINASLELGTLYLEPIEEGENPLDDEELAFALWGRFSLLLASLEPGALTLLSVTLERFLAGLAETLTGSLDMRGAIKA